MAAAISAEPILGEVSPGVRRIQAEASTIRSWHRWVFFFAIFLCAYSYGLDGQVRYTFQGYATASFEQHSLLATINVVRSIIAAAVQPAYAKVSDVFGRLPLMIFVIIVYTVGTIVEATADNLGSFCAGAILYQLGYTGIILLLEILIADTTTLRNRLLFSFVPALPFIINTWISGNLVEAVTTNTTWHWGIGMWAIIFPVVTLLLVFSLTRAHFTAKREGLFEGIPSPWKSITSGHELRALFWQIDLPGLLLLAATLALILLPFTLAGGEKTTWQTARVIATIVIGFVVALPAFVVWEWKFARHPLVPFKLLRQRTILAGLSIAAMLNCSWYLQGDYLYPILIVAFDESALSAQRISSVYSFVSVIVGVVLGFVVRYTRRMKWFIVAGTCLFTVAFGILIYYRGGGSGSGHTGGMIGGQFLLGFGGGMLSYPTQAMVQAACKHEHVAMITALFLATYQVGSALGFTISGALWTQTMYQKLEQNLGNATIAASVYADPYTAAITYPVGTPERTAIIESYQSVQRLLCITGLALSILLIIASLCLKNYYLVDAQSRPEAEDEDFSGSEISHDDKKADSEAGHEAAQR